MGPKLRHPTVLCASKCACACSLAGLRLLEIFARSLLIRSLVLGSHLNAAITQVKAFKDALPAVAFHADLIHAGYLLDMVSGLAPCVYVARV